MVQCKRKRCFCWRIVIVDKKIKWLSSSIKCNTYNAAITIGNRSCLQNSTYVYIRQCLRLKEGEVSVDVQKFNVEVKASYFWVVFCSWLSDDFIWYVKQIRFDDNEECAYSNSRAIQRKKVNIDYTKLSRIRKSSDHWVNWVLINKHWLEFVINKHTDSNYKE